MDRQATPLSQPWKVTFALALFLSLVPALRPAAAADPCAAYPQVCRYTYDPVERCCIADPRFDCFDVCFSSTSASSPLERPDLATPERPLGSSLSGQVSTLPWIAGLTAEPAAPRR
jgi:hypothetical protein